jgi:hypothetical protein
VPAWIASLNVAVTLLATATLVAFADGLIELTVGAVVSGLAPVVNDHDTELITFPDRSCAPESVAV